MSKYAAGLCLLALWAAQAAAGEIKGDREVAAGRLIVLEYDGKAGPKTQYAWTVQAADAERRVVELDVYKRGGSLVTTAPAGSVVTVGLTVVDFDEKLFDQAQAVVKVTGKGPGPDPKPPPRPDDALTKSIKDAYARSDGADRAAHLRSLAGVYRSAADADIPDGTTAGGLLNALKAATKAVGLAQDDLRPVREVIAAELRKVLPADADETLTADHKVMAKAVFRRVTAALEEASK